MRTQLVNARKEKNHIRIICRCNDTQYKAQIQNGNGVASIFLL